MLDGAIEVSSDITTNQIWTTNNTYHITAGINIQALLVIEPGTIIEFAYGTYIAVNNGGTLISCGTPDNPVIYTSDSATPGYGAYTCAIFIDETASPSTKVTYSYIEYAEEGIWVMNNRLDSPIENNYLYSNLFGILEYGVEHTDIYNNLIYASYYNAIEINMESYEGQADANSHILIQNNTCDYYQDVGIAVFGVANEADAGEVKLTNNIVSESYQCGIVLANGWMYFTIVSTGYYGNAADRYGYEEPNEYNPVYETEMPYVDGTGILPICYLRQDCNFINKGYEYIEETHLIGKTTDVNNFPDSNKTDLGFHYPNWDFSNAGEGNTLTADLNHDLTVNFKDFAFLSSGWQTDYNINDLNTMADQWLNAESIGLVLNQDPNIVSDVLQVSLAYPSDELSYYFLIDGQYYSSIIGSDIEIPTYTLRNGLHEIKAIACSFDEEVLVGTKAQITVQNRLQCLTSPESYKFDDPYIFGGFYEPDSGSTINLQIVDLDDNVIWSNSSAGDFNFVIPVDVLQSPYNQLHIQEIGGLMEAGWPEEWIRDIVRKFNVTNDPCTANAQSLLVGVKETWTNQRKEVWKEYLNACNKRSLVPTICLFHTQATRANIRTALSRSGVKAVLIITDGNRKVGLFNPIHRTFFEACDGIYFSYLGRNWSGSPDDYEPLPPQFENGYSVADLWSSFYERPRMYIMVDACKNGTSVMPPEIYSVCGSNPQDNQYTEQEYERTADMAYAFAIYNDITPRLYMSWRKEAFGSNPLLRYNRFLKRIWYQVGRYETFNYAISDAAFYEAGNCLVFRNFSYVGNVDTTLGQ